MQPRIYTYKISFEEVPYYYYGSKKEKKFNEDYWGSPVTNKWCWELYTPRKQILELFDYTSEGYEECIKVENRLIKPVLNDVWCLNENYSNFYSLKVLSDAGKKGGNSNRENKTGICGRSKEKMREDGIKNGNKTKELGLGIFSMTKEEKSQLAKQVMQKCKENNTGIYVRSKEQQSAAGKIGGKIAAEKNRITGKGLFGVSIEQRSENGKKSAKTINSQKWVCLETGYISNPAGLCSYQRSRGIDYSKRKKLS
jgi:hypothetical protein